MPINKTPLWSRRRPQISSINEQSEATSSVSYSIQNVYKRKETVEDLKEQILREELDFKRKLYDLQLQAAAKDVEIKTAVLDQIKGNCLFIILIKLIITDYQSIESFDFFGSHRQGH